MRFKNTSGIVKAARKNTSFTQEQVADAMGIRVQQYSSIERGVQCVPKRHIVKLCKKLGFSPVNLIQAIIFDKADELRVHVEADIKEELGE